MRRKWFRIFLRRRLFVALLLFLQVCFLIFLVSLGSKYYSIVTVLLTLVSAEVSLHILAQNTKGGYKLIWIAIIMLFPVFGGLFYLLVKLQTSTRKYSRRLERVLRERCESCPLESSILDRATTDYPDYVNEMSYLEKFAGFRVYDGTETEYLSPGEEKFSRLIEELKKAEKYIFLEYFIIQEGVMWDSVLRILTKKAAAGVEVRVMYDDVGCFLTLPKNYPAYLAGLGIKCTVFNPFRPVLSAIQNNRDHRKIFVIDGKVAFTGGINLADEYINLVERFGHWKDASIMLRGRAAWSFTLMFLQMWAIVNDTTEDYAAYYPWSGRDCEIQSSGYVQPYADSPMDTDNVGENVYLRILGNAKKYVYINTPYLIVDDSMFSALTLAAKSGVDVRIVTPCHPDKKLVHVATRSYYRDLIEAGVRIYEYSMGFMHSKIFVADDTTAAVGTTNLDFRSLYLHFECGVMLYGCDTVKKIKEDFIRTLDLCEEITAESCRVSIITRLFQSLLRLLAPLL